MYGALSAAARTRRQDDGHPGADSRPSSTICPPIFSRPPPRSPTSSPSNARHGGGFGVGCCAVEAPAQRATDRRRGHRRGNRAATELAGAGRDGERRDLQPDVARHLRGEVAMRRAARVRRISFCLVAAAGARGRPVRRRHAGFRAAGLRRPARPVLPLDRELPGDVSTRRCHRRSRISRPIRGAGGCWWPEFCLWRLPRGRSGHGKAVISSYLLSSGENVAARHGDLVRRGASCRRSAPSSSSSPGRSSFGSRRRP